MRDRILASKFDRLQPFLCETPTVPVSPEAGFRNRDIKVFQCSYFNHGTNQCRAHTRQVANFDKRDNPFWFIRPTIAVLI